METASDSDDSMFGAGGLDQRIQAVIYGAAAAPPRCPRNCAATIRLIPSALPN
jgi:hypothetical protein